MLHFEKIGSGKPVVFLHGFLESSAMWESLDLAQFPFQSILIDLPGHGKTTFLPDAVSIAAMAQEVSKTLISLNISEYDVVGHSMGGYVAMQLAKINAGVNKICLLNSNFWEDAPQKKIDRNRVIEVVKTNAPRFIKEAISGLFAQPENHEKFIQKAISEANLMSVEAIVYATKAMRDRPDNTVLAQEKIADLKIIQGELDQAVPLETMLEHTRNQQFNMSILPNVAHMTHEESTADLQLILRDFFIQ
jgi:pimeloyl-ACP methyl ester carboxylesterase